MRKIFINGKIYTLNQNCEIVDAFVIEEGKIVFTGGNKTALTYKKGMDEVIDLDGKTVYPAFLEPHAHVSKNTDSYFGVNLAGYNDLQQYKDILRKHLERHPDSVVIRGSGWAESMFSVSGPSKKDLDEISREIPIVLESDTYHTVWVNSCALELWNRRKYVREIARTRQANLPALYVRKAGIWC